MKTRFLLWLMGTKFYKFLLKYVIPEITIFHGVGPNYLMKKKLSQSMKAGDFILSKSGFHLTNLLIGGRFSHGAVVIGDDKIAEMTANDFDIVDVNKFCKGTTRIALMRIKKIPDDYGQAIADKAMQFADRRYDTNFELGVEALYCSELCYQSDFEHRMGADLTDLVGMGRPYISPEGIYSAKNLEVVFEWEDRTW